MIATFYEWRMYTKQQYNVYMKPFCTHFKRNGYLSQLQPISEMHYSLRFHCSILAMSLASRNLIYGSCFYSFQLTHQPNSPKTYTITKYYVDPTQTRLLMAGQCLARAQTLEFWIHRFRVAQSASCRLYIPADMHYLSLLYCSNSQSFASLIVMGFDFRPEPDQTQKLGKGSSIIGSLQWNQLIHCQLN